MYLISLTKDDRSIEVLLEREVTIDNIVVIVEQYFLQTQKDYADFYFDRLGFMKEVTYNIEYLRYPRIYVLYTGVTGWDTYDSGVFSAWTEERARAIAEKKSEDFKKASIELIGIYNSLKEEEICCSFNAG